MKIGKDKLYHFAVCSLIAMSVGMLFRILHSSLLLAIVASLLCSIGAGAAKEYGDKVNPYNKWDWKDMIADTIGAITGVILCSLLFII